MTYSPACTELTKRFEGCRLKAYPDPALGDKLFTIGWGHTFGVRQGMTIDQHQADCWLAQDLTAAAVYVDLWVKSKLTQPRFDALTDFVFNVGPGLVDHRDGFVWLKGGGHSTMLRYCNAGAFQLAAEEFLKWNIPHLPGILARREAERALFLQG